MYIIDIDGPWRLYTVHLPAGSTPQGTITRAAGDTGALVQGRTGIYAQVNAGVSRTLDQRAVSEALAMQTQNKRSWQTMLTESPFEAVRLWSHDGEAAAILTDGTAYAVGRYPMVAEAREDWRQTSPEELQSLPAYRQDATAAEERIFAAHNALRQPRDV